MANEKVISTEALIKLEKWEIIPNTFSRYAISNFGRVKKICNGRILKPRQTKLGYLRVHILFDDKEKRKDAYIHRLVANAFCIKPNGCDVINHIDCDITNNNADNLEWTTQRQNVLYSMRKNRMRCFTKEIPVVGVKNGKKYEFISASEASKQTGCDSSEIIKCCRHKRKSAKGYIWEYREVV